MIEGPDERMTIRQDLLDDSGAIRDLDRDDMLGRVREQPEQMARAWDEAAAIVLPPSYRSADRLVVFAMGGSAIAADLLRGLLAPESTLPIDVVRGYEAPAFVDGRTIAVASSHSGQTEETLASFTAALERGALPFVITRGGTLADIARRSDMPRFEYAYDGPPRAAIAYSLMPLLAALTSIGAIADPRDDVAGAIAFAAALRDEVEAVVPLAANPAKRLAALLQGRIPVVYGAEHLRPVARRWRTQLSENAENWAFSDELPELNHNTVVGYANPHDVADRIAVVMLHATSLHPRVALRYGATRVLLRDAGVSVETVEARGDSRLAEMLTLLIFGDYVSLYLALLNGADPSETRALDALKRSMAESPER